MLLRLIHRLSRRQPATTSNPSPLLASVPVQDTASDETGIGPTEPDQTEATPGQVMVGLVICLSVTGLLSSARLVTIAERQEFGPTRENWLEAAQTLDDTASRAKLDRPAQAIEDFLHEDSFSNIVLGELATAQEIPAPATTLQTTTSQPSSTSPSESTDTTTTTRPATTTTTATPLPPLRTISQDEPIRIWAGGDSLGEYVGSRLQHKVADLEFSTFTLDYHISTGIARPDYFDWPANLSNVMLANDDPTTRPEAVIYMVGGNDDQPMLGSDGKLVTNSGQWLDEYRARVALMMDITAYPGIRFYWVGLPPMRDERREAIANNVNAILEEEAAERDWVTFIDIVPLLLGPEGDYQQYIVGPDGAPHKAREGDGVHVTAQASQWISAIIWELILDDWGIATS